VSRVLTIEPEAEAEITEAATWYDEQDRQLRARFLVAVDEALDTIRRHPEQYQFVYERIRRIMVSGFPYGIFYLASDREVNVVSCFHCSRDPRRWQSHIR
jgi:toxin ParE1/3/4